MDKVKIIHDTVGHTLTVWFDDPTKEHVCEETAEEVLLMKDAENKVIGFELLHYYPASAENSLTVETVVGMASQG
jgi:hypothetical protein